MPAPAREDAPPRRFSKAALPWEFAVSAIEGWRGRNEFRAVEKYCMFIGYPRSGHSLVGSLVDAHPEAVIAHELDVLRYLHAGFRRSQLFALIMRNDRQFTATGRRARVGGYEYTVPNQWQGRHTRLRVIGDKRGGRSTRRIARRPRLLDDLRRVVALPIRVVHVVRNPFDNISTIAIRSDGNTLDWAARYYFSLCDTVAAVRDRLAPEELLDVRYEDVVADPRATLGRLCGFLGLEPDPGYLDDCAGIVFASPHRSREDIEWSDEQRAAVEQRLARFDYLAGYSFAD